MRLHSRERCWCCRAGEFSLLLVVYRGAADLLAHRIGSASGDCAAFAVGRDDNATARGYLAAFLNIEPQRTVVNPLVRPSVGIRIARERIALAVVLALPPPLP